MRFDVEGYVRDHLQGVTESANGELCCVCPSCGKPGRFYINRRTGNFICFKCDFKGVGLVGLIAHIEDVTYEKARRFLMREAIQFRRAGPPETLRERIGDLRDTDTDERSDLEVELPDEFVPVFDGQKWRMPAYLKDRGVDRATADHFGLGFCKRGRFANRIVIPIRCPSGSSFTARDALGIQSPKYLNPKGADHSRLLFGWPDDLHGELVLVEGPLDAIRLHQFGFKAVALLGKILHETQLALLSRWRPDTTVTVMLDPEEDLAPLEVGNRLLLHFKRVFVARLPLEVDPGSATRDQVWDSYVGAVQHTGKRVARLSGVLSRIRKVSRLEP